MISARSHSGFTLVELAASLTIIALVAAMITTGSNLIATAKLNKVIAEMQYYEKAYQTFFSTYDAYPGDFDKATAMFSGCAVTTSHCNGNGDGYIKSYNAYNTNSSADDEVRKTWKHLELSAIIANSFSQLPTAWSGTYSVITSIPESTIIKGAGYIFLYGSNSLDTTGTESAGIFSPSKSNILYLGKPYANGLVKSQALTPLQALNIDVKLDDGIKSAMKGATTGSVRVFSFVNNECHNASTGVYNLTLTSQACTIGYEMR